MALTQMSAFAGSCPDRLAQVAFEPRTPIKATAGTDPAVPLALARTTTELMDALNGARSRLPPGRSIPYEVDLLREIRGRDGTLLDIEKLSRDSNSKRSDLAFNYRACANYCRLIATRFRLIGLTKEAELLEEEAKVAFENASLVSANLKPKIPLRPLPPPQAPVPLLEGPLARTTEELTRALEEGLGNLPPGRRFSGEESLRRYLRDRESSLSVITQMLQSGRKPTASEFDGVGHINRILADQFRQLGKTHEADLLADESAVAFNNAKRVKEGKRPIVLERSGPPAPPAEAPLARTEEELTHAFDQARARKPVSDEAAFEQYLRDRRLRQAEILGALRAGKMPPAGDFESVAHSNRLLSGIFRTLGMKREADALQDEFVIAQNNALRIKSGKKPIILLRTAPPSSPPGSPLARTEEELVFALDQARARQRLSNEDSMERYIRDRKRYGDEIAQTLAAGKIPPASDYDAMSNYHRLLSGAFRQAGQAALADLLDAESKGATENARRIRSGFKPLMAPLR